LVVKKSSRAFAIAEAVLVVLPLTIVAVLATLWSWRYLLEAIRNQWHDSLTLVSLICVGGLIGVIAGWFLLLSFIRKGRVGLRAQPWVIWFGAGIGASAAIAGAGLALSGQGMVFAVGLPALIPLAHMWRERSRANG
jgi:hypothetical protein